MITDSQSLIDSINSTKQIESKLLRCTIKWIKQMVDSGFINSIRWCDTEVCLSDCLTKQGSKLGITLLKICAKGEMIYLKFSNKKRLKENMSWDLSFINLTVYHLLLISFFISTRYFKYSSNLFLVQLTKEDTNDECATNIYNPQDG